MHIVIREATAAEAALIADISRQTFYDTFAPDNSKEDMEKFMSEQFTRELLMSEVGAAGNIFFLAYAGDAVAGYVRLREKSNEQFKETPAIEIARIYVLQSMIGKGVGKKLMEASIAYAVKLEKKIIWLGVWENNIKAIAFYQRFGFEKFSETGFLLGNDLQTDWLMKKHIS